MKIGLYIVNQLHDITQAGYKVTFNPDWEGMMRIEYNKEFDESFYEHDHVGAPSQSLEILEKNIIKSLNDFRHRHSLNSDK